MSELLAYLIREENITAKIEQSEHWQDRDTIRHDKIEFLKDLGNSGDIDAILEAERDMLKFTLELKLNHKKQRQSIEAALSEINQAFKMLERVRDPERYQETDQVHGSKKKRDKRNALPMDDARNFFDAHSARFTNMNKSEMTVTEKRVIDIRQKNIRLAKDLYIDLQRHALGVALIEQAKSAGIEM